jgi:Cu-Zn family superoxide dismutase
MLKGVAVFKDAAIQGEVVITPYKQGVLLKALFTKLPAGPHGFHIHKAGDLRGEGCMGLCEHYDIGHHVHGGGPTSKKERHTGDLGNIEITSGHLRKSYELHGVKVEDLWGRSIIVHEDQDDLGKGPFEDSLVTGHSGKRMACAIFGRGHCTSRNRTRKQHK